MFALLAVCLAAPVPKAKPTPAFFPTTVGTKWVYLQDREREWTDEVVAAEEKDGGLRVTVRQTEKDDKCDTVYAVAADGVTELSAGRWQIGWRKLKFPVKEGDAWDVATPVQQGLVCESGRMTVGKTEDVKVPAGAFKAVRVEFEANGLDGQPLPRPARKYTWWYAEGVGVVEFKAAETHRVLKSFTPAPAKPAARK